ncbi:MAG: undecaprenyl-phosphate glucose phosphotransferase [Chloroflexi bacterium]|nr:undecaprenyl-phosphate glucose phosphotransferase [Chloroflexota bacterium]
MNQRRAEWLFGLVLVLGDVLVIVMAFYLGYRLRLLTEHPNIDRFLSYLGMVAVQTATLVLVMAFHRLYFRQRGSGHFEELTRIFSAVSIGFIVGLGTISLLFTDLDYSRLMMVYSWGLTVLLLALWRLIYTRFRWALQARGVGKQRVVIVGTAEPARMIFHKIAQSPGLGYEVVGFVDANGAGAPHNGPRNAILGAPVLGRPADLPKIIEEHQVEEVIIGLPEATHREILSIIANCEREKVGIKVFPDVFQIMASEVSIGDLGGLPLLTVRDVALRGWRVQAKRAMDVVGAAVALVIFSPLMMLTALLIKLESPGPVFYVQERMGLDARSFPMLKFRSMRQDAESFGPGWTVEGDPRRTRLGTLIRRISVDELPQFVNVLWGDMSLVGPRPERPVYVEQFRRSIPRYMERHREKAGLTGWAQVNGLRGDTSIAERLKYDLWYVENWSLLLDLRIILRTMFRMFADPSAY